MDRLNKSVSLRVTADTREAVKALDNLNKKMDTISRKSGTMKVAVDDAGAKAALDKIALRMDEIARKSASVRIGVNTAGDTEKIAKLEAELASLRGEMDRVNKSGNGAGGGSSFFGKVLVGLIATLPSLVPILGVAAGGVLALGSSLASAGGALGVFGLAVKGQMSQVTSAASAYATYQKAVATGSKSAATDLKAYQAQLAAMPPALRSMTVAYIGLQSSFKKWSDSVAKFTAPALITVMKTLASDLPKLTPILRAMAPATQAVANGFAKWSSGGGLTKVVNFIVQYGVPAFRQFIQIAVNLAATIGGVIKAFAPMGTSVTQALVNMTAKMREWANGSGVQAFVSYIKANAPAVKALFEALWGAIKNLTESLKLAGPFMLSFTTLLLKLIAGAPPQVITALAYAFLALKAALSFGNAIKSIQGMVDTFKNAKKVMQDFTKGGWFSAGPIIIVLAAIALAAVLLATHWKQVTSALRTAWDACWGGIKAVASAVWNFMKSAFAAVTGFLHSKWGWLIAFLGPVGWMIAIGAHWRQVWDGVKSVANAIWGWLRSAWIATANTVSRVMSSLGSIARAVWNTLWNGVRSIANGAWNWIKGAWTATANTVSRVMSSLGSVARSSWNNLWNGIRNIANGAWNWIKNSWNSTANFVSHVFGSLKSTAQSIWHSFWGGIKSFAESIWNGIKSGVNGFKNAMVSAFHTMVSGIRSAWNALRSAVAAPVKFFVNTVYGGGLRPAWNNTIGKIPGIPKMPAPPNLGFATGGYTGDGGKYEPKGVVHGGEYVLRKEATQNIPRAILDHMNRTGSVPGYAGGGAVPGIPTGPGGGGGATPGKGLTPNRPASPLALAKKGFDWGVKFVRTGAAAALSKVLSPVKAAAGRVPFGGSAWGHVIPTVVDNGIDKLISWIKGKETSGGSGVGGKGVIPTGQHKQIIDQALAAAGVAKPWGAWESGMNTLISRESAWNSSAVNRTDINAQQGHPSEGLAQVIASTFNAYVPASLKGKGQMDPVANVAAAIRYIISRYGGIGNVQQADASKPPKGYWTGGIARGLSLVGERGPELINAGSASAVTSASQTRRLFEGGGGDTYNVNITVTGASVTDQKAIEDLVVKGITSAKRKGRLK